MIYYIWTRKILELTYWTRIDFIDDILELDLKKTQTPLLDSN